MEEKLTLRFLGMGLFAAVLACVLTGTVLLRSFTGQVKQDLQQSAHLIAAAYDGNPDSLARYALDQLRITLIAPDGQVRFESSQDAQQMDNHGDRPEIVQALAQGEGEAMRQSETYLQEVYYYALRLDNGDVLRASMTTGAFYNSFEIAYPYLVGMILLLAALSILLSVLLTRKILRPIRDLAANIDDVNVRGTENNQVYAELAPFVREIQSQRRQITFQFAQLEEERAKMSLIIAHMSEGLIVLDGRNRIIAVNQSARESLRLPQRCEGENLLYVSNVQGLREAITGAEGAGGHCATLEHGGRTYRVFSDVVISAGARVGVVLLMVDITQTQALERMRQEFTANVSHELKTPLTSISGYAEMIETGIAQEGDIQRFAERIHKEATRMIALIGDIMRLSALDEGAAVACERVALAQLARETAESQELSARQHEVELTVSGDDTCVMGDRTLLREMIHNLIDNAVRYNRPDGSVQVRVSQGVLMVRDTGIGIPKESCERVFERFYRVDKSRSRKTGGTGLGLAIVRHVAQLHHAELSLESEEGVGTTITVRFKEEKRSAAES